MDDDIAIIGIGCRFPGANNIDEFWRVLVNGENHVVDIPSQRWNNDALYSEDKDEPGKLYVKKAAFINRHDEWDNRLFGISDNEAAQVDPQQRHVLECVHMAMEDSGILKKQLQGSETGVFIGAMNGDYQNLFDFDHDGDTNYSATGSSNTIISARVSYVYNLQGPSMVIDTACSSSMTAVHLGCQAIRTGECEMAICGGVASLLSPCLFISLCRAKMLSPTCQCQAFCDTADGYVRGEGCGIVFLKSYKKAVEDGNKIWGILKTGVNQDGRMAQPLTAPAGKQQERLLKKIYSRFNINPLDLQYIECHVILKSSKNSKKKQNGSNISQWRTDQDGTSDKEAFQEFRILFYKINKVTTFKLFISDDIKSSIIPLANNGGTGTPVGDPTEVNALGNFIQTYRDQPLSPKTNSNFVDGKDLEKKRLVQESYDTLQFPQNQNKILIGSVKTNIGHLESAAGIAALIKVLLMMEKGKFVPSLHVRKDKSNLNKKIKFEDFGLDVSVDVSDWPPNAEGQRVCCVNSFGFGGSNSHAVIIQKTSNQAVTTEDVSNEMKVISISALDKTSLKLSLTKLKEDISSGSYNLQDVSFTSLYHREQFATKTLVYGTNMDGVRRVISQKLHDIEKLETPKKMQYIFVFCGVGTAWNGMCKEMMETQPKFRSTVAAIDEILEPLAGIRMADKFSEHTDYSDPFLNHVAIFCTQVALFELWQTWGVRPKVIIGQSVGEVAAAYASGALNLSDAVQVIFHRSKCLARQTDGSMMVIGNYSLDKLKKLCTEHDNRVVIAVFNSPVSCTLSGDTDVMEKIKSKLEALNERENAGILIKKIAVQCAYHSQHVDSCLDDIRRQLKDIKCSTREIPQISTVTGEFAGESDFHTGEYWADNIRKPVRFMHAVEKVLNKDVTSIFVEIGPRQVLRVHLKNITDNDYKGVCLPSMNDKKENECIYASLSTLHEFGAIIRWQNIIHSYGNVVAIPRYVGKTTNSLYIPQKHQTLLKGISGESEVHMYVRGDGGESGKLFLQIDKETTPFIYDHYFYNVVLVPGATYIEAAFAIGQRITDLNAFEIAVSAEFESTLMPQGNNQYLIDIQVEDDVVGKRKLFVARNDGKILCRGTISQRRKQERNWLDVYPIKERCTTFKTQDECYAFLERGNFKYGDSLRIMQQAWATERECLVEFDLAESVKSQCKSTHFHPCIIDGLFQSVAILSNPDKSNSSPTLPKGVESVVINRPQQSRMLAYTHLLKQTDIGSHYNFLLITPDGHVIAEIENFYVQTMSIPSTLDKISFKINWREVAISDSKKNDNEGNVVVFGSKRFIECYKAAEIEENSFISVSVCDDNFNGEDSFRNTISKCASSLQAVVFAPCYNIQHLSQIGVFTRAKDTFSALRLLLIFLQENNLNVPLYVVTENTVASDMHNISASNICGSELWGMSRSSVLETAFDNLVLIDTELTSANMVSLQRIIRSMAKNVKEYLLSCGRVFCSEILEYDDSKHMEALNSDISLDTCDYASLKTSNPAIAKNLYFELCRSSLGEDARSAQESVVRLHSICLHEPSLFPISPVLLDTEEIIWPEDDSKGFQMMCLEGTGWIEEKFQSRSRTNPTVGFCFPTDVKTVIRIPSEYTFDIKCFKEYIPGMMAVAVVLLKIVESCESSTNVFVIADNDSDRWVELIRVLFSKLSSSKLDVQQKDAVAGANNKHEAQTVVILSNVTHKHIEILPLRFPNLKKVVSLEQYFPKYMKIWIEHEIRGVETDVLMTEDLFTSSELPEKMKTLTKTFRSLTNTETITKTEESKSTNVQKDEHRADILHLPFPVLTVQDGEKATSKFPLKVTSKDVFRKNGCYILVGGLTGLGWELLQLLAEYGAGYIATLSRRRPSADRNEDIRNIVKKFNCTILPTQADISNLEELKTAMREIQSKIGDNHIKGIFHGGGVTADKLLKNMTDTDIDRPLLPKILGTWNLHTVSKDMELDFFVMHSSVAGVIGNAGQCNYAAGNTFQDAVAHYRKSLGLCGMSINWSALSLGMAKERAELESFLKNQGFYYLSLEDIKLCFMRALTCDLPQVMFGRFDWEKLRLHPIVKMFPHKFSKILSKYEKTTAKTNETKYHFDLEDYHNRPAEDQKSMILELIKVTVGDTFVFDETVITEETNFVSLGIDSMAAMSFTNFIFEASQVRIPVGKLFSDSATVASLISYIREHIPKQPILKNMTVIDDDNKKLLKYLQGDITFMQKMVLDGMKKHRKGNFAYQIDFEIIDGTFNLQGWRKVLNHIVKMNPDLRRVYKERDDGTYESTLKSQSEVDVEMMKVEFESICQEEVIDKRNDMSFDLTKDLPIKLQYASRDDTTRIRLFIHCVTSDLSSLTLLFSDLRLFLKLHNTNQPLPEKDTSVDMADVVRSTRALFDPSTKLYWKDLLTTDIQPFTFGANLSEKLNEDDMRELTVSLPLSKVKRILAYVQEKGISVYSFAIAAYMVTIHQMTKVDVIAIPNVVDMRSHIPQLGSYITRGGNVAPFVADLRNMGKVEDFLKRISDSMSMLALHSMYPFELIKDEIHNEEMKRHIGRHLIAIDNMTNVNKGLKDGKALIKSIVHTRCYLETGLIVVHGLLRKEMSLNLWYNSKVLKDGKAKLIPKMVFDLMEAFMSQESTYVGEILAEKFTTADMLNTRGSLSDTEVTNSAEQEKTDMTCMEIVAEKNIELKKTDTDDILTEATDDDKIQSILYEGLFRQQSSDGREQDVTLSLIKEVYSSGSQEVALSWRTKGHSPERKLSVYKISDVTVKEKEGSFYIMLKIPSRWFVFKSYSKTKAMAMISSLREAVAGLETMYKDRKEPVFHVPSFSKSEA